MQWDFTVVWNNWQALLTALWVTSYISIASIVSGTLLGLIFGVGLLSKKTLLRLVFRCCVELLLALPPLVLILWLYFCPPMLFHRFSFSGTIAAITGLSLSLSAFVAEIIRAGVNSIPKGQREAALSLGMSRFQMARSILAPQVVFKMLPTLMGQYITCYKFSTLASVVTVNELLHTGSILISTTYRPLEIYTAIAVIFVATIIPLNILAKRLEKTRTLGGVEHI